MIDLLSFILFVTIYIFLPGYALLSLKKSKFNLENIFLSFSVGLVVFTLFSYLFELIGAQHGNKLYLITLLGLLLFTKGYTSLNKIKLRRLTKSEVYTSLLIIAGSLYLTLPTIRSGTVWKGGLGYWGALGHDGIWHEALIKQLINQVPPRNPIYSSSILSNYHYYYDLLVAETTQIANVGIQDLLYRYYPLLFSILLGVGSYILLKRLFKNNYFIVLTSLFVIYFGSSFGWIVTYLKDKTLSGESVFWMNQTYSFNINPPFAISLVIFIAIAVLLMRYLTKPILVDSFLLVLLSGVLIEFKVYAGILVLGGMLLLAIQEALKNKKYSLMKISVGSIVLAGILYLPQNISSSNLVVFEPLWFTHSMIDAPDRVGWERLSIARQVYASQGVWVKLVLAEILAFTIFIVGNMGTRILSFFGYFKVIKEEVKKVNTHSFLIYVSIISFILPMLFIQRGNSWNTIQFGYYFLYISAIYTGYGLYLISKKLPKVASTLLIVSFLVLTPISSISNLFNLFNPPNYVIAKEEVEALTALSFMEDGIVLIGPGCDANTYCSNNICPGHCFDENAYV